MKVILISIGTLGDIEPLWAIGDILKEKGCHVICAFPEQFRKLALKQKDINKELVNRQCALIGSENPDRIVYNGKAIYPIIWRINNRGKAILVSPVPYLHYVKNHTHVAFYSNYGSFLNKLTYGLANLGLIMTVQITAKWLKMSEKITRKQIKDTLSSNRVIYTISPSLFPRPDYWRENLKILGYHERNKSVNWHPDKGLTDFLGKHKQILFITFGSMTNPEPLEKTRIILSILERNEIPAIVNTAAGGLSRLKQCNAELIHFVSGIPYDWIFPKIYGVIHHGGSGTTHMALKYGCASMIIPHVIDQFVWNKLIFNMGIGPKGIRINKITAKNLEPKILELVNNVSFKERAEQVSRQMGKENFKEKICESIIES